MSWPPNKLDRGFSVKTPSFKAKYKRSKRKPILCRKVTKVLKSAGFQADINAASTESTVNATSEGIPEMPTQNVPVEGCEPTTVPLPDDLTETVPKFPINLRNSYHEALCDNNGISVLGSMFKVSIIQDFNIKTRKLKPNSHALVTRRVLNFTDGCKWVYSCSCNKACSQFTSTLETDINETHSDFLKLQSQCLHLVIVVAYVSKLDIMNNIFPEDALKDLFNDDHTYADCSSKENHIYKLQDNCICLYDETTITYGVLMVKNKAFWCSICHSTYCSHVRYINTYKETPYFDLPDELHDIFNQFRTIHQSNYKTPVSISKLIIPFKRTAEMAHNFSSLHDRMLSVSVLQPRAYCQKCSAEIGEYIPVNKLCPVLASQKIYYVKVNSWKCKSCSEINLYDGLCDGLLNMGTYIVSHEILRTYLHGFLHGKRTLFAFYMNLKEVHLDYGHAEFPNLLSYNKLKNAWYSYMNLLDINYTDGFCCEICGSNPDTVICDGTSLAFTKKMLNTLIQPEEDGKLFHGREIVLVDSIKTRKLLRQYSKGKPFAEFQTLLTNLKDGTPEISNFLQEINMENNVAPLGYKKLIASLGSDSPVCTIIPHVQTFQEALTQSINGIDIRTDPKLWKSVQVNSPVLFDILCKDDNLHPLPDYMKGLLKLLLKKSVEPFQDKESPSELAVIEKDKIACFPSLPSLRGRGRYSADKAVTGTKERCKKDFKGHPSLLPGIFTIFCSHGICYGFEVMNNHESVNIPFTIFRTRFSKAPNVIVYDFACSLHKYCLRRDPVFFKHTKFFVDRFHWYNHKACSHGYNLDLYPQYTSLNTQINEQANAGLKRIKDMLSYMTQDHFMSHCRLFLYNKNINKQDSC